MTRLNVTARRADGTTVSVAGRDAWALHELIRAGAKGCTPITHPGPRWSSYVFKLRRVHSLNVETVDETHGGAFPGRHARYVLRDPVELVAVEGDREAT
jgi:hypothetical protein